jgi:hypothetical protein
MSGKGDNRVDVIKLLFSCCLGDRSSLTGRDDLFSPTETLLPILSFIREW